MSTAPKIKPVHGAGRQKRPGQTAKEWVELGAGGIDTSPHSRKKIRPNQHNQESSIDCGNGDNRNRVGLPTTQPLTAVAGEKPNRVIIHVDSFIMQYPLGQVGYNSGSIGPLLDSTLYYVYCDDPHHRGGAQTYLVSTKESDMFAAEGRAYIGTITTPGRGLTKAVNENPACGLGEWADNRLPEFQYLVGRVRSGDSPERLREQFSLLFTEVIDCLQTWQRDRLFEAARGRRLGVPDLMAVLAEIKHLAGTTLIDYRKQYRRKTGKARSRRSAPPSVN